MPITKTYDMLILNGVKGWIRDSWARRKIADIQTAIAGIVVPIASTANPQMDGTAAPGVSTDYARADHVHPHDTSKADAATTLAGYGITNAYTKTEVDGMIPTVPTKTSDLTNDSGYITSAPVQSVNGQTGAVTLDATDVGALPDTTPIPTVPNNVSAFTNDAGYITGYTETDPTVPAWAKASTKPTYTASEVGAQDALTSAQLDACNSGITAALVANIKSITTGSFSNASTTYIDSVSGQWIRVGDIVTYSVSYKMKAGINTNLTTAINGFPTPLGGAAAISRSSRSDSGVRYVVIDSGTAALWGAHSANTTYHASGSYIAAST